MNTYVVMCKGNSVTIEADSLYKAKTEGIKLLNVKKKDLGLVSTTLVALEGKPYTNSTNTL